MTVFTAAVLVAAFVLLAIIVVLLFLLVKSKATEEAKIKSVTRFLFVTTQVAALGWISASYVIAGYSTIYLGQPFPVVELSQEIAKIILGQGILKVVSNVFEHNDGGIFGTSNSGNSNKIEGNY